MTKFTIALREIGTYKEVLRSQVLKSIEYVLSDLCCAESGFSIFYRLPASFIQNY